MLCFGNCDSICYDESIKLKEGLRLLKLNLPCALSLSRLVLLPILFWLVLAGHTWFFFAAYLVLGSTDFFDALLARRFNQVTPYGKIYDSVSDLFFYIASAWFLWHLFPEVVTANIVFLWGFFILLGLSFAISGYLFKKPVMMHTRLLRLPDSAGIFFFRLNLVGKNNAL
ncbi:MAG: CDP-alcohol phosphatidyltransferase family protein [Firmicutes bacterium]|nr:CDP-alcohol phosphatidyltransferase family protein [Bacillota bacterium]